MKLAGIRAMLPVAFAATLLAASGCDKAKEALEKASGVTVLDDAGRDAILAKVGWDVTKNPGLAVFKIHKAFELADNFKGDLSDKVNLPIPVDAPEQAQGTAEKQRSIVLAKVETFKPDGTTEVNRLRIVTVARVDAEASELVIDGDVINQYIPQNRWISLANNNQAGQYLLIEGKGEKGLAYLTGTAKFIAAGKSETDAVSADNAMVFTSSSPFVTLAGDATSGGKYFLAILEGSTGTVFGFKNDIAVLGTGTPTTTTKEMAYAGVLDQYKGQVDAKGDKMGLSAADKSKKDDLFNKANTKVTDFLNGWQLVVTALRFKQPPQAAPKKDPEPTTKPKPATPPTPSAPADKKPAETSPVVRKPDAGEDWYNVDLGCSGFDPEKDAEWDMIRNGADFDTYDATHKGWRATGDVRYSYDLAELIFPSAGLGANYLDGVPGYCVLTTGDQAFATSSEAIYQPGPDGAGQTSEMWQKVNVPSDAKAIQMRVAFFSSEFPAYVGSSFNDSFFVKFDESPDMLAFGTLNDLAGGTTDTTVSSCATTLTAYKGNEKKKCGEWQFTKDLITDGDLWSVGDSTQMPADGATFGCLNEDNAEANPSKCFHGMIPSRIICKDLSADDIGKLRTLPSTSATPATPTSTRLLRSTR